MQDPGAWPSGKAAAFGAAIAGTNPAAPTSMGQHCSTPALCPCWLGRQDSNLAGGPGEGFPRMDFIIGGATASRRRAPSGGSETPTLGSGTPEQQTSDKIGLRQGCSDGSNPAAPATSQQSKANARWEDSTRGPGKVFPRMNFKYGG